MTSRGTGAAEIDADRESVLAHLRELTLWTTWFPGVTKVEASSSEDVATWTIDTPVGPSTVELRFEWSTEGVTFDVAGGSSPAGAFSRVAGGVRLDGERPVKIVVDLELDGSPPPPPPMAGFVAQGASVGLERAIASAHAEDAPAAPTPELISVPMSDGGMLAAHHYRAPVEPAPVVLFMTPYRKEGAFIPEIARLILGAGFHLIVADVRGFGGSIAEYGGLLNEREVTDYAELVEWSADQAFSDGNVATMGASYVGANQFLVAARRPKGLRCISPVVAPIDTYRDWTHRGGIPTHTLWGAMTYLGSGHTATAKSGIAHYYDLQTNRLDDDGHRSRSPEYVIERIEVPALVAGGWHDYFLRPSVRAFNLLQSPKRLVVGPWGHGDFPPKLQEELVAWLRYWLRGEGEDPTASPSVHLYETGSEEWRAIDLWPAPASTSFHEFSPVLEPRALDVVTTIHAVPMAMNFKPQFMPDPTNSGFGLWGEKYTFDSDPLEEDVVCSGPVALLARLAVSGATDVDLHARVSTVRPDGAVVQITEGRLRASHRALDPERTLAAADGRPIVPWHPHDAEDPLPEGSAVDLAVEVMPICHNFKAGERIRLGITLVRADEGVVPATATLHPETALLLPLVGG